MTRRLLAAAAAAAAAAALLLPWQRAGRAPVLLVDGPSQGLPADTWTGVELAGTPRTALVIALAILALALTAVATLRRAPRPAARSATAAAGAAATACAASVLLGRGDATTAAWITAAAGAAAVLLAVAGRAWPLTLVAALVAATAVPLLPGPARPEAAAAGAWRQVATSGAYALRSGAPGLPLGADLRLVAVEDRAGVITADAVVVADEHGRAVVLARSAAPPSAGAVVLGVVGDRVVHRTGADRLTVASLRSGDDLHVVVRGAEEAGPVGADGSLWLRADGDPPGTVRRLDVAGYVTGSELAGTFLPVVAIREPDGGAPVDVLAVLPVRGGALRVAPTGTGARLERLDGTANGGLTVTPLAGGAAPGCGVSRSGPASHLGRLTTRAVAADDTGAWLADPDAPRLLHVDADGALRAVDSPLPAPAVALTTTADGSVVAATLDGTGARLWRLADPRARLADLPEPAAGCAPSPAAGG